MMWEVVWATIRVMNPAGSGIHYFPLPRGQPPQWAERGRCPRALPARLRRHGTRRPLADAHSRYWSRAPKRLRRARARHVVTTGCAAVGRRWVAGMARGHNSTRAARSARGVPSPARPWPTLIRCAPICTPRSLTNNDLLERLGRTRDHFLASPAAAAVRAATAGDVCVGGGHLTALRALMVRGQQRPRRQQQR